MGIRHNLYQYIHTLDDDLYDCVRNCHIFIENKIDDLIDMMDFSVIMTIHLSNNIQVRDEP